jgi:glycosyltransferase involved in cell wall biosynthesis
MVFHRDTPFLRPALASALKQTFADFELVLVDNGTGLAADALGELGRDPRLRWVRLARNEGIPAGHNAGVAAAQGEFIALQDYDDLVAPERLERQVMALRADSSLGLVSALAERINEKDQPNGHVFCLPEPREHSVYAPYATPVITPVAMGRREVFRSHPYRAEFPFAGDLDFQARVADEWKMAMLPHILLRYRWYTDQTTQQRSTSIEQSRCVIQIATGRRRLRRPENLEAVLAATSARTASETWLRGARVCLADRLPVFAAFQARRAIATNRSAGSAWKATRLAYRAWRQAHPSGRALVLRMFFTGPVRALRLHPI